MNSCFSYVTVYMKSFSMGSGRSTLAAPCHVKLWWHTFLLTASQHGISAPSQAAVVLLGSRISCGQSVSVSRNSHSEVKRAAGDRPLLWLGAHLQHVVSNFTSLCCAVETAHTVTLQLNCSQPFTAWLDATYPLLWKNPNSFDSEFDSKYSSSFFGLDWCPFSITCFSFQKPLHLLFSMLFLASD